MMTSQRRVLVVDADTRDRTSTVLLLEAAGYQVRSARSFEDARALLVTERPDLLVTDLRLGPYNGLHLVLWSRNGHPEMATVVTSRFADPVLEAEARRNQADFLLRPVSDTQLLDAVSASLNRADCRRSAAAAAPALPTKQVVSRDFC
jgi:two-component system response regulator AtoC